MPQEGWVALGTVIGFILLGLASVTREYLKTESKSATVSPSTQAYIAAVGTGWIDREQAERHIAALESIAASLKSIADGRQSKLNDKMDALIDRLDQDA